MPLMACSKLQTSATSVGYESTLLIRSKSLFLIPQSQLYNARSFYGHHDAVIISSQYLESLVSISVTELAIDSMGIVGPGVSQQQLQNSSNLTLGLGVEVVSSCLSRRCVSLENIRSAAVAWSR
ncbi:hypothetical protein Tco_0323490 [Tanacetum coccineum]